MHRAIVIPGASSPGPSPAAPRYWQQSPRIRALDFTQSYAKERGDTQRRQQKGFIDRNLISRLLCVALPSFA